MSIGIMNYPDGENEAVARMERSGMRGQPLRGWPRMSLRSSGLRSLAAPHGLADAELHGGASRALMGNGIVSQPREKRCHESAIQQDEHDHGRGVREQCLSVRRSAIAAATGGVATAR
jgi:hypothetical protein